MIKPGLLYEVCDASLQVAAGVRVCRARASATQVIIAGNAFMQNVCRGHHELAVDVPAVDTERVAAAITELSLMI